MEGEKNKKYNIKNNVYNYLANFCLEEQNKINEEDAENAIIYGIECYRVKFSKFEMAEICLSSSDNNKLDIFIKDDSKIKSVNLEHINNIIIRHQSRISTLYNFDKRYNYLCDILENKKYYQLFFKEKKTLLIFIKGLLTITRKNYENSNGHLNLSQIIQKNVGDEIEVTIETSSHPYCSDAFTLIIKAFTRKSFYVSTPTYKMVKNNGVRTYTYKWKLKKIDKLPF